MNFAKTVRSASLLAVLLATACINTEETVVQDAERVKIEFENDKAARLFYETLSGNDRNRQSESKTEVHVPFVFSHKHKVIRGENSKFNDAVRRCDTNQDGKITEAEAKIFWDQRP